MRRSFLTALVLLLAVPVFVIGAEGRNTIGYQGRLMTAAGQPVPGPVNLTFAIYGDAVGGTALWSEVQTGVPVQNGIFSVRLGEVSPIPGNLFNAPDRYLGIKVGADAEMAPRSRLTSVAYAFNAQRVGGKKVLMGSATLTVNAQAGSGIATIVFTEPFAALPAVTVSGLKSQIGSVSFVATEIGSLTVNGCTITFRSLGGTPSATGSAEFDWIAVGE